jgi:hypothetical protein
VLSCSLIRGWGQLIKKILVEFFVVFAWREGAGRGVERGGIDIEGIS